jgi:hypothetical protein
LLLTPTIIVITFMFVKQRLQNMNDLAIVPDMMRKTPPLLQVKLSEEHFQKLDEIRRKQPDLPTRSDMIRRMIDEAAVAPKAHQPSPAPSPSPRLARRKPA